MRDGTGVGVGVEMGVEVGTIREEVDKDEELLDEGLTLELVLLLVEPTLEGVELEATELEVEVGFAELETRWGTIRVSVTVLVV